MVVSLVQRQGLILAEVLSLIMAAISFIFIKYIPRGKFSSYYMSFGFILAVIAVVGVSKSTAALTLLIPLLILGVPIIDSSYSIVANYASQESPTGSGIGKFPLFSDSGSRSRNRLRQKLQSYGFSAQGSNLTIIGVSLYLSLSAFIISIYLEFLFALSSNCFWLDGFCIIEKQGSVRGIDYRKGYFDQPYKTFSGGHRPGR